MNELLLNINYNMLETNKRYLYKLNNSTVIITTIGILFKAILDYAYVFPLQIDPFGEMFKIDIIYFKVSISYIITFLQFYFLPRKSDSVSTFVLIMLMYIMVPVSTIYSLKNENSFFYLSISILFILFELISSKMKILKNNGTTYEISNYINLFLYFITILVYFQLFIIRGIPTLDVLHNDNIYQLREHNALINNRYLYYFVNFQAYSINPIFIAINYLNKHNIKVYIYIILQSFLFLWLGHKYMFYVLFTLYAVCLLSKYKQKQKIVAYLLILFVFGVALARNFFIGNRSIQLLFSYFVNRALFVPAVLKFNYYDFFIKMKNVSMGLWGTIIAPFLYAAGYRPPYHPVAYTKVIGDIYAPGSNANTGLWAAEIAHFGLTGVFVTFFCLIVFIYVIKISEKRNGIRFTFIVSFTSVMGLNDAGIINILTISPISFTLIFLSIYTFKQESIKGKKTFYLRKNDQINF